MLKSTVPIHKIQSTVAKYSLRVVRYNHTDRGASSKNTFSSSKIQSLVVRYSGSSKIQSPLVRFSSPVKLNIWLRSFVVRYSP